ncbi:MAG: hypothetical protein ACK55Z_26740, partial [bacterium]
VDFQHGKAPDAEADLCQANSLRKVYVEKEKDLMVKSNNNLSLQAHNNVSYVEDMNSDSRIKSTITEALKNDQSTNITEKVEFVEEDKLFGKATVRSEDENEQLMITKDSKNFTGKKTERKDEAYVEKNATYCLQDKSQQILENEVVAQIMPY